MIISSASCFVTVPLARVMAVMRRQRLAGDRGEPQVPWLLFECKKDQLASTAAC